MSRTRILSAKLLAIVRWVFLFPSAYLVYLWLDVLASSLLVLGLMPIENFLEKQPSIASGFSAITAFGVSLVSSGGASYVAYTVAPSHKLEASKFILVLIFICTVCAVLFSRATHDDWMFLAAQLIALGLIALYFVPLKLHRLICTALSADAETLSYSRVAISAIALMAGLSIFVVDFGPGSSNLFTVIAGMFLLSAPIILFQRPLHRASTPTSSVWYKRRMSAYLIVICLSVAVACIAGLTNGR